MWKKEIKGKFNNRGKLNENEKDIENEVNNRKFDWEGKT